MKYLSVWIIGMLIFSGCLDFIDEIGGATDNDNGVPIAVIKIEGDSPFEPDTDIIFSGKGSSDPDNDILEYYWDFDKSDGKDENKIGSISEFGKIIHYYSIEKTYTVTLTVSDGDKTASTTINIKIERNPSNIRAIVDTEDETESVMDGEEQITYTFSAAESESESDIIKYEWDFSYESSDGFTVDEESSGPEINRKFDSGIYIVKIRITNENGESDESSHADDVELKINFDYETTRTIDSGQQEHMVQLYGFPAKYIRATLEYETSSLHDDDLDLYLYNYTQDRNPDQDEGNNQDEECNECVAKNYTHDTSNNEQINFIQMWYYNSTDRVWFDNLCDDGSSYCKETGDWFIVVDQERGNAEYTLRIEVLYWE